MKTLLVVLFIILFIYLIIHMCSGSGDRGVPTRSDKGFEKSLLVLDGLRSLGDKDLSRLRDDLQDLKALLDKKPVEGGVDSVRAGRRNPGGRHLRNPGGRHLRNPGGRHLRNPGGRHLKSGKEILNKIRKGMNKLEGYKHRENAFSKCRVVLVQIALILITILMIVL